MNTEISGKRRKMKKGFTLIELVVAIAILAMMSGFAGVIFNVSVGSHRTALANAEIMQKLRAITDQLNRDFSGLEQSAYIVLRSEIFSKLEFQDSPELNDVRMDRIYYFCTGDFQSWFHANVRSNIARVYFGHDNLSLTDGGVVQSRCRLARDVVLLTPGATIVDSNALSLAEWKADPQLALSDANSLLWFSVPTDLGSEPNNVRRLLCQNAGAVRIEWTDGSITPVGELVWWGLGYPIGAVDIQFAGAISEVEELDAMGDPILYTAVWNPRNRTYWPRAIKFTFMLYDSRGIIPEGRTFTHIVYLGD